MHVAVEDHLPRSVRISGPKVMELDAAAIHVFPTHVEDAPVGKHPGRVVVIVIARDHANVAAIGIAAIQRGHARKPAVDEPTTTAGTEHNVSIRQVRRFDIVKGPACQLPQFAAVRIHLV